MVRLPEAYDNWIYHWDHEKADLINAYQSQTCSFIPGLLPELAMQLPVDEVLRILEPLIGRGLLDEALQPENTTPSPLQSTSNSSWMKRSNVVGINVRTIGNFFNCVKYALTLPQSQQAIHLLPIWEPGVVASLYGMASWNINPEFFSEELYQLHPHLDRVERQLKVVINLLHAMGRVVGMDVIPHTDRYSEIVLANPQHFEWLERDDLEIVDHSSDLHEKVQEVIFDQLQRMGSATTEHDYPKDAETFFSPHFSEASRKAVLFGALHDYHQRHERRGTYVQALFRDGLEPVPATMAPPYRGLKVKADKVSKTEDQQGRVWREYEMIKPESMSRVFGPLTRYKLYERLDNNQNWAIDFEHPRKAVWEYVCENYLQLQQTYNFDFMRGDMSHVQMRPDGVPAQVDEYYDIQAAVANTIRTKVPYFAYFAETFLAPAGYMAYGDETDHLDQSDADATLGDLQSMVLGSEEFMRAFRWYLDLLNTRHFAPSFTLMTGDKDDPRFDKFYLDGNEIRLFVGLFLTDMPSYMGLGFETRDPHPKPAPNEHYTKLYVFKIDSGEKATTGPYVWGKNGKLFHHLSRIRLFAEALLPGIHSANTCWLRPPDPTGHHKLIAWTQEKDPRYLFVANLDTSQPLINQKIPFNQTQIQKVKATLDFSTKGPVGAPPPLVYNGKHWQIDRIEAGEARVYKLTQSDYS